MSHRFLDFVEQRGITATVFIVAEIARGHPGLVRRVADDGHEIGLHGLRHAPLGAVGPERLLAELREGRELLENLVQAPIRGFRAPIFSLTPNTKWAVEHVVEAGFLYSSSVLPAGNPLHGWPGLPRRPFRWDHGLIELPCPVAGVSPVLAPFLGGVYLRYIPLRVARHFLRRLDESAVPWSYLHPYDLDTDEPFFVMPYTGWLTSFIAKSRCASTLDRLEALVTLDGPPGPPLGEIAEKLASHDLPRVPSSG